MIHLFRNRWIQRTLVLGHTTSFGFFLGASLAVTLLGFFGETMDGGVNRVFAFSIADRLQEWVILPAGFVILLSGSVISATSSWGFFKYRWMIAKLLGSAILTVHAAISFAPLTEQLLASARITSQLGQVSADHLDVYAHFIRVGVIQVVVAFVLAALGIIKPGKRIAGQ